MQRSKDKIYSDFFLGQKESRPEDKETTSLKYCKKKKNLPRILYPGKISFKNEGKVRLLSHTKEDITGSPAL